MKWVKKDLTARANCKEQECEDPRVHGNTPVLLSFSQSVHIKTRR